VNKQVVAWFKALSWQSPGVTEESAAISAENLSEVLPSIINRDAT